MTIASELEDLQTNLANAKAAVVAKGGTVGDTGLAGLTSEIASIPSGSPDVPVGDYGKVEFYKYMALTNLEENYNGCSVEIVDIRKLASMYVDRDDDGIILNYLGSDEWAFLNAEYETVNYTTEELLSVFGLSVTDIGSGEVYIRIWGELSVDKFSGKQCYSIDTLEDFNKFCFNSDDSVTIDGDVHNKNQIVMFIIGSAVTTLPSYFLRNCVNLADLDTSLATNITSVGDDVLSGIRMPKTIVSLPNVTTIGDYAFSYSEFSLMELGNVVSIGHYFMTGGRNGFPNMPKVETIGDYCFYHCSSLAGSNTQVRIPNSLKTLGRSAFSSSSIQSITINASSKLESIGLYFCDGCSVLNNVTVGKDITGCFAQSDQSAFITGTGYLSYAGGMVGSGVGIVSLKNRFPDTVSGTRGRKWRS